MARNVILMSCLHGEKYIADFWLVTPLHTGLMSSNNESNYRSNLIPLLFGLV